MFEVQGRARGQRHPWSTRPAEPAPCSKAATFLKLKAFCAAL